MFGVYELIGSALWKRETIATNTRVCGSNRDGPLKDIIEIQYSRKDEERYMLVLDFHTKDFLSSVIQNIDTSLSKDEIWQCQNVCSFSHVIVVVRELSYYNDYSGCDYYINSYIHENLCSPELIINNLGHNQIL